MYTNNIELMSDLSLGIVNSQKNIKNYYRLGDEASFDAFIESRNESEQTVQSLRTIFSDSTYYIYIRILENINDYIKMELSQYNQEISFDTAYYNHQQRVLNAFSVMGIYSNEWMSHYIKTAKLEFDDFNQSQRVYYSRLIVILLFGVLLAFIVSYKTLQHIASQLQHISEHAEQLTNASWGIADLESDSVTELNTLSVAINTMKRSLNDYFFRLREKADLEIRYRQEQQKSAEKSRALYKTQYQLLASKVDPHFLFNSLNIIYRQSMFAKDDEIMRTTSALSEVLRYNLEFRSEVVSLKTELSVLDSYLYIHRLRFDNNLTVEKYIDSDLIHTHIMPFILQPSMEILLTNTIWDENSTGTIQLKIQQQTPTEIYISLSLCAFPELCVDERTFRHTNIRPLSFSDLKQRLEHFYRREIQISDRRDSQSHRLELVVLVMGDLSGEGVEHV